jgi:tRNA 2-thiouridine synthesizing protein A
VDVTRLWLLRTASEPPPPAELLGPGDEVAVIDGNPGLLEKLAAHDRVAVWGAPAEVLDLTGEVCPFTFVRTKLRLEELPPGARLVVVVDHEPATRNVPRSAAEWGQRVLAVTPMGGAGERRWTIEIEKRGER